MDWEDLLDLWKKSEFKTPLPDKNLTHTGVNTSCGDSITYEARVVNGIIVDCRWSGVGCVLSQSSAAALCERSIGLSLEDAKKLDLLLDFQITPLRKKCVAVSVTTFQELATLKPALED